MIHDLEIEETWEEIPQTRRDSPDWQWERKKRSGNGQVKK